LYQQLVVNHTPTNSKKEKPEESCLSTYESMLQTQTACKPRLSAAMAFLLDCRNRLPPVTTSQK